MKWIALWAAKKCKKVLRLTAINRVVRSAPLARNKVSVRYSTEVLSSFRSTGAGWQTRMDAALKILVKKDPDWLKNLG